MTAQPQDDDAALVERLLEASGPKTYRHATRTARTPDDAALLREAAARIEALARLSVTTPDTTVLEALRHARGAIASLEEGQLGYSEPQSEDETGWPIQAELLHMIDQALASTANPTGASE